MYRSGPTKPGDAGNERCRFSWRTSLAIGGIAVALLLPLIVRAMRTVSTEAALREGLSELEPGERSVTVSVVDSTGDGQYSALGTEIDAVLQNIGRGVAVHQVIYREASDTMGGGLTFGGADGLTGLVHVTEGRLPRTCRPERCEVIQLGATSSTTFDSAAAQSAFGLVMVGRAERADDLLFSGTFQPALGSPLLIGDGTDAVVSLAALRTHGRTFGWVMPVDSVSVVDLGADSWVERAEGLPDKLDQVNPYLVLTLPSDAVRDQARRADASTDRFGLIGLALPVAVLGGLILGATGLRRALSGIVLAIVYATASSVVLFGVLAVRSPLGFGHITRSARGGMPAAAIVLATACASLLVAAVVRRRRLPPSAHPGVA